MNTPYDPQDIPVPVAHYQKSHQVSRTTMWRYEQRGLRVLHVGGKRFIKPSDWTAFIEQEHSKNREAQP